MSFNPTLAKYNYLQHSFEKQTQKSYDRNNQSPPSLNSPNLRSPSHNLRSAHRSSQFSPYENRKQNSLKDKIIVQQLRNENRSLLMQIAQYKSLIVKIEAELRIKTQEIVNLQAIKQKQKLNSQQIINQMREQIGLILTKNTFLEENSVILQKQLLNIQRQLRINDTRKRTFSITPPNSKQPNHLILEIENILDNKGIKHKKRHNGKVLNQTFSNIRSVNISPTRQNKIAPSNNDQTLQRVQILVRKVQKYEELIGSIKQMHQKITGKTISYSTHQLKMIWKWLKQLGHNQTICQKWKQVLIDLFGQTERYEELTIDDVLKLTVAHITNL